MIPVLFFEVIHSYALGWKMSSLVEGAGSLYRRVHHGVSSSLGYVIKGRQTLTPLTLA
jgi:hypothetical protein